MSENDKPLTLSSAPYEKAGRLFANGRNFEGKRLLGEALRDLASTVESLDPLGALALIAVVGCTAFAVGRSLQEELDEDDESPRQPSLGDVCADHHHKLN
jgi:hypothetical protein